MEIAKDTGKLRIEPIVAQGRGSSLPPVE